MHRKLLSNKHHSSPKSTVIKCEFNWNPNFYLLPRWTRAYCRIRTCCQVDQMYILYLENDSNVWSSTGLQGCSVLQWLAVVLSDNWWCSEIREQLSGFSSKQFNFLIYSNYWKKKQQVPVAHVQSATTLDNVLHNIPTFHTILAWFTWQCPDFLRANKFMKLLIHAGH